MDHTSTDKKEEWQGKRFLIVSTYGSDCAERCYAPYVLGMTAAATGHKVEIFHMMDAAELGMAGVIDIIKAPPPMQPFREIVKEAEELGVKIYICEQSAAFRNITKDTLRKGVEFRDVLDCINGCVEADRIMWI